MNSNRIENTLSALAGIVLIIIALIGAKSMIDDARSTMPAFSVTNTTNTNSCTSGSVDKQNLGNITLQDLGLQDDYKNVYHHSLEVYTIAEDPEYWEIEQLNGKYYRVRREDYDDNWYGHYEFDTEEPIGDAAALYKYAKNHNIIPQ